MIRANLSAALLLCMTMGTAGAAGVYKWTDADGKVHFTDKPPPGAEVEKVRTTNKPAAGGSDQLEELTKKADEIFEKREEQKAKAAEKQKEAQKIAQHCASVRQKLTNLRNSTRNQTVNEKGEREFLGEERRQAWISDAEKELAEHCR